MTASGEVDSKSSFQFKYKIEENGLGKNVKVSVYKSETPIETQENYFNCEKKSEKISGTNVTKYYEICEEKDLGNLIQETVLNGGQENLVIGKDTLTITTDGDATGYYYFVLEFLNLDEEQNEDMNRTLNGKVTVELIPSYEVGEEAPVADFTIAITSEGIKVDASASSY